MTKPTLYPVGEVDEIRGVCLSFPFRTEFDEQQQQPGEEKEQQERTSPYSELGRLKVEGGLCVWPAPSAISSA